MEGYRIFARHVEGPMEWLLGVWSVCKGCMDNVQRAHGGGVEGVQRVCRGCAGVAWKSIEWLLGVQSGTWTGC